MGKKRIMVRGVTLLPSESNNARILDLNGRGDKNIVKLQPEEKSAKPVEGSHISTIWIAYPEGVH